MESQIDLMVKQVADILGVKPLGPAEKKPPRTEEPKRNIIKDIDLGGVSLKEVCESARNAGNAKLADGLLRVLELVNIPEEYLLRMYKLMSPEGGRKSEYLVLSAELLDKFGAEKNADMLIRMMHRAESEGRLKN